MAEHSTTEAQTTTVTRLLDCFVAALLAMTGGPAVIASAAKQSRAVGRLLHRFSAAPVTMSVEGARHG